MVRATSKWQVDSGYVTLATRYRQIVFILICFPDGKGYSATTRPMTER